ncbi:MAG: hypothetical protein KC776_24730 [Myxococcales bacterium]|nr:hypothetical protein [Myxococcales bacterium]MCB9583594.1 hypothetical protein [Polyangiaceae bacterium]
MREFAAFCFVAVTTVASTAAAQSKECIAHHASGKKLRSEGSLMAAKEEFLKCAADGCPKIVRDECLELVGKVARETPSIVVAVKDGNGRDVTSGRVTLDDRELSSWTEGLAEPLDPGPHTLAYTGPDGREAKAEFIARDGDKRRTVEVTLPAASTPPPTDELPPEVAAPESSTPVLAYVLAGVAVVGLGSFTYFALDGQSKKNDLDDCKPHCQQTDVDAMRRSFLIGDISLGVGALALGGSAYFFLSPSPAPAEHDTAAPPLFLSASGTF